MDEKIEEMAKDIEKTFTYAKKYYDDKYEPFELEVYPDEIARELYQKGYRKESDTAREILAKLLNMGERAILNDIINPYECFFVSFDKFKKIAEKYGVDLGE